MLKTKYSTYLSIKFYFTSDHAAELGNKVSVGNPIVFSKPSTSIILQGSAIEVSIIVISNLFLHQNCSQIPKGCQQLDHEVELGVVIGKTCKNVKESHAMENVMGYVLALGMWLSCTLKKKLL